MAALVKKPKMDMTQGVIIKQIILFSLPIIATTFMQLFFNTADTIMVGWFGGSDEAERNAAIAAVGSCSALINLIISIFSGLSVGAGVSVSHEIGAKKYDNIEKIVHTAVALGIICGTFVSFIGIVFSKQFLILMGTTEEVLPKASAYMKAYFAGTPALLIYNYCAAMLRAEGDTTRPFIFITTGGAVNVLMNFIFVCLIPLGALGVGIATAFSQWTSCVMIIVYMIRTNGCCKLSLGKLRIYGAQLKKIIAIGLPAGIQGSMFSVANVFIQSSVNSFNSTAIMTGNSIGSNVGQYIIQTGNSIAQSTSTFVGQNIGAKNPKRIKQGIIITSLLVFGVDAVLGIVINLFSGPILSLFAPGSGPEISQAIAVGQTRLLIMGLSYCIAGFDAVSSSTLQSFGKSTTAMTVALVGACGFRLLWIFTVFQVFHEIWVLYLAFPISWVLLSTTQYILCLVEYKKFKKKCSLEETKNEVSV